MDSRFAKQIIIALIFFGLIGAIVIGLYLSLRTEPICSDGIQNGKEEGIDCGFAACGFACVDISPLKVISHQLLEVGEGDFDLVFRVSNPNSNFGASAVGYEIPILDKNAVVVDNLGGTLYILPGQTKYIVTSFKNSAASNIGEIKINTADWQEINLGNETQFLLKSQQYRTLIGPAQMTPEPDLIPDQNASVSMSENSSLDIPRAGAGSIYSELDGVLLNNSDFDFNTVDVAVVLFDDSDNIVGVNRTVINSFFSQAERYFKVRWPFEIKTRVFRADVEATTNLFENQNFIKTHGGATEKFQRFY